MKITAIFIESNPVSNPKHAKLSGKRVEIIKLEGDEDWFEIESGLHAYEHELTEPSHPLSLLKAKQRILGK